MDEDRVIICRCEEVTLKRVRELLDKGLHTMDEIKRISRCGMGPCQGKTCRPLLAQEIANYLGIDVGSVALPTFRPPTKPVKLGVIARGDECD
ncbi:MAG: (2Fe-2S)-binding protein [Firmicutes bacterium]|jgi:bacterioferritin-associated ferredoxin|nr:(2Fe-2S)-binding protein [Bacillota bacterium]